MSITLTSPEGSFEQNFNTYGEMVKAIDEDGILPYHLSVDPRINKAIYDTRDKPENKKVEHVKEALAKMGFKMQEHE